jgi:hypothetical protein
MRLVLSLSKGGATPDFHHGLSEKLRLTPTRPERRPSRIFAVVARPVNRPRLRQIPEGPQKLASTVTISALEDA